MNPPYGKLRTASATHERLRRLGVRTSNLYSAFVWLASRLLAPGGQLVAITPRSFCNGSYFRPFRQALLDDCALRDIHVFESRDTAFRDGAVLQENIIFRIVRSAQRPPVQIAVSSGSGLDEPRRHEVSADSVVHPTDPRLFIRVPEDRASVVLAEHLGGLPQTLAGLGVTASTGRVVDFRSREHLREDCDGDGDTIPLIYPGHLRRGRINWPGESNSKPCAIAVSSATEGMFLPSGDYVLVKRFSSKEERRRVVAAVLESVDLPSDVVAMENHVNVLHVSNRGMERDLAWGLAAYLNSTIVDLFFRQFNGHTQVNAADLESLRYPDVQSLLALGAEARSANFEQAATDLLVERHVPALEGVRVNHQITQRISEAQWILKELGFPPAQSNERSALAYCSRCWICARICLGTPLPRSSWTSSCNLRVSNSSSSQRSQTNAQPSPSALYVADIAWETEVG